MSLTRHTRVEKRWVEGEVVFVKREDLTCDFPGPPFSKVRGLYPVLSHLKDAGVSHVGYMETAISMAGWGICWICDHLGLTPVIFYPRYKGGYKYNQPFQMLAWSYFKSIILPVEKPNLQSINYYVAKRRFHELFPEGHFLPLGLPFPETVQAVSDEVQFHTPKHCLTGSIVVCAGSGAMAAGIVKGVSELGLTPTLHAILVHKKDQIGMRDTIMGMSNKVFASLVKGSDCTLKGLFVHDLGYDYTDREMIRTGFPCNEYYDRKAYKFIHDNIHKLKKPILFWNIGA